MNYRQLGFRTNTFIFILLCLSFLSFTTKADDIFSSLTFYVSFDDSLSPDNHAGGNLVTGGDYIPVEGVAGKAIQCDGNRISYVSPGNHTRVRGSISVWYYPSYEIESNAAVLFEKEWFRLSHNTRTGAFNFLTGRNTPDRGFLWDYSTSVGRPNLIEGWNHIFISWDRPSGDKTLYINGKLVASGNTTLMGGSILPQFWFGNNLHGKLDELMIFSEVLTDKEVERLYADKIEIAQKAKALPHLRRDEVKWTIFPDLAHKNFIDSLVDIGEKFTFSVPLENRADEEKSGVLTLNLLDFDEKILKSDKFDVKLAAGEKTSIEHFYKVDSFGIYKVEASVLCDGTVKSRDVTTFGCVPSEDPTDHPFFGIHVRPFDERLQMSKRLGFNRNRVLNMSAYTWWVHAEPERGQWVEDYKKQYEKYIEYDMPQLGVWYGTPYWASRNADGTVPPKPTGYPEGLVPYEWDAYDNYVKRIVLEYPGITDWEIWNEPYVALSWYGTAREYAYLANRTYKAAKSVRDDLRIFVELDATTWGRDACNAGLLDYADGVAFHWYHGLGAPGDGHNRVQYVKEFLSEHSDRDFPLLNTESGMNATMFLRGLEHPRLPPPDQVPPHTCQIEAVRYVQFAAEQIAEGVETCYYYFLVKPGLGRHDVRYAFLEATATPRPFAISLCMFIHQLDGGDYVFHHKIADELFAYVFERNDGKFLVAMWTNSDGEVKYNLKGTYFDMFGNLIGDRDYMTISERPVYCHIDGIERSQIAELIGNTPYEVIKQTGLPTKREDGKSPKVMQDYSVAGEYGIEGMRKIDISSVANMGFADETAGDGEGGWTDEGSLNDMRVIKPGEHIWHGIPFDLIDPDENDGKSVLTLRGKTFRAGPLKSEEIPVNLKNVRGLVFAHSANWAVERGKEIAYYEIKYADGEIVKLPVVIGDNIYDWWRDHQDGEQSRTVAFEPESVMQPNYPHRFIRTYYYENTKRPAIAIESIRVIGSGGDSCLTLLGITATVWR